MKQQVNDYDHSTVLATKRHKEPTQTNTHTVAQRGIALTLAHTDPLAQP